MELKSSSQKSAQRNKRQAKVLEENFWDCSVCTYRNTAEAFKCLMCDVRKGTTTRKPRINPQLVAQQVAQQYTSTAPKVAKKEGGTKEGGTKDPPPKEKTEKKSGTPEKASRKSVPRIKNIDRTTGVTSEVTVNDVTVFITEYKAKKPPEHCSQSSTASSELGSQSESSNDARSSDAA